MRTGRERGMSGVSSAVSCWECSTAKCLCVRRHTGSVFTASLCVIFTKQCVCVLTRRAYEYKGSRCGYTVILYINVCVYVCMCVCVYVCVFAEVYNKQECWYFCLCEDDETEER